MITLVPRIHRATHRIGLYLASLDEYSLSQGEAHILALLAMSGPTTIAELHRGLAHKRSTLTSILDRLVARGFVTRQRRRRRPPDVRRRDDHARAQGRAGRAAASRGPRAGREGARDARRSPRLLEGHRGRRGRGPPARP